jgi:hypothetical protein
MLKVNYINQKPRKLSHINPKPMNIPIKEEEIILTPEQQERMYWAQLKYDSHKWIEYLKGYYQCEFCYSTHTSMLSFENVNICKKNPNLFPTDNQTPNT